MSKPCIVGYCPELYDALQTVAHQVLPYEPIDEWPPHARQYNEEDRDKLIRQLLLGLTDSEKCDRELEHYINVLFESISDDTLRGLIEFGAIEKLIINDRGYYLAVEGVSFL